MSKMMGNSASIHVVTKTSRDTIFQITKLVFINIQITRCINKCHSHLNVLMTTEFGLLGVTRVLPRE